MLKLFPKTKICNISECYSTENSFTAASLTHSTNTIEIYLADIKENYKQWRRRVVVAWIHEFSHFLYNLFYPYSCEWDDIDFIELFKDELIAYRIQKIVETLLFLKHDQPDVYKAAVLSVAAMVRQFKQYYGEN